MQSGASTTVPRSDLFDVKTAESPNASAPRSNDPTVIVILGWMGAKPSHVQKYADVYSTMFPHSSQIIVRADSGWYWKNQEAREKSVYPAVKEMIDLGMCAPDSPTPRRVLIHVFSNGGACSLVDIASSLSKRHLRGSAGTSAIVFDSAPGGGTFFTANRSFTAGIRNPVAKYLAMAMVSIAYLVMLSYRLIFRRPHPFKRMLEDLIKPDLLPWTSLSTPRLYLYSAGDKIVEEHVVEEEAAKASRVGFPVELVHFGKSGHVAHVREDPDKYWRAVSTF